MKKIKVDHNFDLHSLGENEIAIFPNGNTGRKSYADYKPCGEPNLLCKIDKRPFVNMTKEIGVHFFEDKIGYYTISGELIATIN